MKTIITLAVLLFSSLSHAQVLDARPFPELVEKIKTTKFTYKETGKIFGFNSIHSCLFVSEEIVIFKNYCYPVRNYPARGYTIITREWGITKLYEEKVPGILLRDIGIDEFPVFTAPYLTSHLPEYSLTDLSGIIEELYPRYNPGCWSTNFSKYTETNDVNCTAAQDIVNGYNQWAEETQAIVNDESAWFELMDTIEARLVR